MASNCCGARVIDYGNTGEGFCQECKEHCINESEDDDENDNDN